jgi:hypothetical protein
MAKSKWPNRNVAARTFRQLRRFLHNINADKVFGTHKLKLLAEEHVNDLADRLERLIRAPKGCAGF